MTNDNQSDKTTDELRQENSRLQTENARLRAVLKGEGFLAMLATRFGLRVFLGKSLEQSLLTWLKVVQETKKLPDEETADVLAALAKRFVVRISLVGLIAVIPTVLTLVFLWQQNMLIREQIQKQTEANAEQVEAIQTQIEQQATVAARQIEEQNKLNNINRRAELLATLYNRRDCGNENVDECPLQSSLRARTEAAKAFIEIERFEGRVPSLSRVNLSQADLRELDLNGVDLRYADLSQADLREADLSDARLSGANLKDTNLIQANLSGASLSEKDSSYAHYIKYHYDYDLIENCCLSVAELDGASLILANLNDANLYLVDLSNVDMQKATYTDKTVWPTIFDPEAAGAINIDQQ